MKNEISATGISKRYGSKLVLNQLTITLQTGSLTGLLGRNGCGKSTLLKILFGTEKSQYTSALLNQKPIHLKENIKEQWFAYLPQFSFVPAHLKLRDIIPLYAEDEASQDAIFYAPGIHHLTGQSTGKLSSGQRRYFEFLIVSQLPHPFLLLDEPFSMVEPLYAEYITQKIEELKKKKGILITDHYYHDVIKVSDKLLLLKDRCFAEISSEAQLIENGYLSKTIR